jgi:hypothetical protein
MKPKKWDRLDFFNFLVKNSKLSDRVAKDYVSRCIHIEKILSIDLINETKNESKSLSVMLNIRKFAEQLNPKNKAKVNSYTANLRVALRKFILFRWGYEFQKNHPLLYK